MARRLPSTGRARRITVVPAPRFTAGWAEKSDWYSVGAIRDAGQAGVAERAVPVELLCVTIIQPLVVLCPVSTPTGSLCRALRQTPSSRTAGRRPGKDSGQATVDTVVAVRGRCGKGGVSGAGTGVNTKGRRSYCLHIQRQLSPTCCRFSRLRATPASGHLRRKPLRPRGYPAIPKRPQRVPCPNRPEVH